MRPYSPGGVLNALASAPRGSKPATPSTHRLQHGLPGYLILFTPHAFASQRQYLSREPPSPLVFLPISTNFTSTPRIPLSPPGLELCSIQCASLVERRAFTSDLQSRLHALYAQLFRATFAPLSYRGCWHRVSRCLLRRYRHSSRLFTVRSSSRPTGLYNPKASFAHAASLRQGFPHCARFPTAASRRSLDRVSVPVWLIILSDQLPVIALVSHYLTN